MKVLFAISAIQRELAVNGIPKDSRNTQQNYSFRGIDDVYAALAPLLHKHGLIILPNVAERHVSDHESKSGGVLFRTALVVDYTLMAVEDASVVAVRVAGEAMDSGDKGSNKAMSAAYKLMAFQTFCVPTGSTADNDSDASSHEVTRTYPKSNMARQSTAQPGTRPTTPTQSTPSVPSCPDCGMITSVMKSKYDAGYYCNPKREGCGNKFEPAPVLPTPDESLDAIFAGTDEIEFS